LSRGITGMVKVMDADTKKHRTTVNIEKAAKLRTVEGPHGPRFVACQETYLDRPPTGETDLVGTPLRSRRIDHEDHQPPKPLILHASSGQQRDYLYGYELPIYAFCL
jgi:hypothetical protein